jgi:hypothetical protein
MPIHMSAWSPSCKFSHYTQIIITDDEHFSLKLGFQDAKFIYIHEMIPQRSTDWS